jgi:hypothetical protein
MYSCGHISAKPNVYTHDVAAPMPQEYQLRCWSYSSDRSAKAITSGSNSAVRYVVANLRKEQNRVIQHIAHA